MFRWLAKVGSKTLTLFIGPIPVFWYFLAEEVNEYLDRMY